MPVNAENKAYLQTLDALDLLEKAPVDAEDPYELLADHIRSKDWQQNSKQDSYYAEEEKS